MIEDHLQHDLALRRHLALRCLQAFFQVLHRIGLCHTISLHMR